MEKPHIRLKVISEPAPETRVVFRHAGPNPWVSGADNLRLIFAVVAAETHW